MNKQDLINLIHKSRNGEIVLICGGVIYYQNSSGEDIEVEVDEHNKQDIFKIFNDTSTFDIFSDNMQIGIQLKNEYH